MRQDFSGELLERPAELDIKQSFAWDYFSFNKGGWYAVCVGESSVLVTDESGDMENGFVCSDMQEFFGWLDEQANDMLRDNAAEILIGASWISPEILLREAALERDEIIPAILSVLEDKVTEENKEIYGVE